MLATYSRPKGHDSHLRIKGFLPLQRSDPGDGASIFHAGAQEGADDQRMASGQAVRSKPVDDQGEIVGRLGSDGWILMVDIFAEGLHNFIQ